MSTTRTIDMHGQIALVTGATSGLGRTIALQLADDGAEVVVHGRDAARGADTVEAVTGAGGRARFVAADLTDPDDIEHLVSSVGRVDVLVNNAGNSWFGPTADLDVATFDSLFANDVRAPYLLVAGFAPMMVANGHGSIVNISSMAGTIGLDGTAAYGAAKAALSSMTRAWAAEFSPKGVRVNAVAAGPIYTRPEARERFAALGSTTLLNRAADTYEIAEVVCFLASPRASYVTGAIIAADGGRTAI